MIVKLAAYCMLSCWSAPPLSPPPARLPPLPDPQEAYELIMGKRAGKDVEGRPTEKSSWDFHDCERLLLDLS